MRNSLLTVTETESCENVQLDKTRFSLALVKSHSPSHDLKGRQLNGLELSVCFSVLGLCSSRPLALRTPLLSLIALYFGLFAKFFGLLHILLLVFVCPAFDLLLFFLYTETTAPVGHGFGFLEGVIGEQQVGESGEVGSGCDRVR